MATPKASKTTAIDDLIDLAPWNGPFTWMRAPYTQDLDGVDIAYLGCAWDLCGSYNTGGVRYGPKVIREFSVRSVHFGGMPSYPFHFDLREVCKLADVGDVGGIPWAYHLEKMIEKLEASVTRIYEAGASPLIAGGDHTIPNATLRAAAKRHGGKIAVIWWDGHIDNFPAEAPTHLNSGTALWLGVEEGWLDVEHTVLLGLRSPLSEWTEFNVLWGHDVVRMGPTATAEYIKEKVGDLPVYMSFCFDALSSETIQSTSWVEPGGPNSNDMNGIMYNLQGINLIGADICEVNGLHIDFSSAHVAAKAATEMACLMAIARGKAEPRFEFNFG